jgi:quercetin dioxygenase-like cupin family protein
MKPIRCALAGFTVVRSKAKGGGMKRAVRWTLLTMGLAGVVTRGAATPPSPPPVFVNTPLARGIDVSDGTIPLQVGSDVVMAEITVQPGGSSGWHSHPGGAIIVVKAGTLTVYRSIGSQCQISTYSGGQAFIERPGEVDDVLNMGTVPYVLLVTFPRVPEGDSARVDEPDPGTCPGI